MKTFPSTLSGSLLTIAIAWLCAGACSATGADVPQTGLHLVVNTVDDHDDGTCGIVDCTLREAINAANLQLGINVIKFKNGVSGTITLQLGSLIVSGPITIAGPGAHNLAISGNDTMRVFSFSNGPILLSGLTIRNGAIVRGSTISIGGGGNVGGGGIFNSSALTVSDCIISANISKGSSLTVPGGPGDSGDGGGIYNNGTLTLERCTISSNTATGSRGGDLLPVPFGTFSYGGPGGAARGGGVFNDSTGTLTINNCTFSNNSATGGTGGDSNIGGKGGDATGAVFNLGAMTVTGSTLTGNTPTGGTGGQGYAGGIGGDAVAGVFDKGTTTVIGSTLSGNYAHGGPHGTGGNWLPPSGIGAATGGIASTNTTVKSTIIAGNGGTVGFDSSRDVKGPFTSGGYNLIGSADHSTGFGATGDQMGTEFALVYPALGPLQNNGGKTDTMALLANSPAIGTSNVNVAPDRDQRGYIRSGAPDIGAFEFNGTIPVMLANISARAFVQTDDNVMIGGFIVSGIGAKKVIIRAIGPSLANFGITNPLQNPTLKLHDGSGAVIATNDNWGDAANHQEITNSGLAPGNPQESAILTTLNPGNYTAMVSGVSGGTGIALVECYDLDPNAGAQLGNISARAMVLTGDNIMIGGFIVSGPDSENVIIRAIGPSLAGFGITNAMQDPTLELRDVNGDLVFSNDNWEDAQETEIQATGLAPSNFAESAIVQTLAPGNYTAIVKGKNDTTGLALVEVYGLN